MHVLGLVSVFDSIAKDKVPGFHGFLKAALQVLFMLLALHSTSSIKRRGCSSRLIAGGTENIDRPNLSSSSSLDTREASLSLSLIDDLEL